MRTKKLRRIKICIFIFVGVLALGIGIFAVITSYRMSLIPSMSFDEMVAYTTKSQKDAVISVGIIKDGDMSFTVYGEDGIILPKKEYEYEIGSITKAFTSSLLCKAIDETKVELNDSIDEYINLPKGDYYPTFERLVTHTSGYKGYYFDSQMTSNFFHGDKNDFYGISTEILDKQIAKHPLQDKQYEFKYSNFGISVVGNALSQIYGTEYSVIMSDFINNELKLSNTRISEGTGNLKGYWNWKPNDGYIPAGAIISTITDMMKYVELHMTDVLPYLALGHSKLAEVNATTKQNEKMGIRIDSVGIGWMIDSQNNIIWHNGGTSNFNSYIAFDKERKIGVVILSNLAPSHGIPATVMGSKLMIDLQNANE